ncbi:Arm DNA-binding domain-containing protein (plasmid) [Tenacibaculum sp. ZS6-P6]|uniref:Arm DNA-binding domain-containing protein n=1 Tax=Tenacibaculum sp. ZS6-P6 TaxID=3447503 RepID=UPI003F9E67CF
MQDLLSVLFYVRKSKDKNATHATIYLRITYDGKRAEASTLRKAPLSKWNSKANKVIGSSIEAKQINRNLDIIKNRIYEIYQKLLEKGEEITAVGIKNEYLGNSDDNKSILSNV